MSFYAEQDYEGREYEQSEMENDPAYWAWLNNLNKDFTSETELWYNISNTTGENTNGT